MQRTTIIPAGIFILILVGGFLLRIWNLPHQGFISWDEGMYINEARFYQSVVSHSGWLIHTLGAKTLTLDGLLEHIEGWPPSSAKPLQGLLIALIAYVTGLNVLTAQYCSVFFGMATIIMLTVISLRWWGVRAALYSALFCASSGYHIYVSRIGVPETSSAFFFLLALFWYERTQPRPTPFRYTFLAGIAMALSLGFCYRWIAVLPAFLLYELYRVMKDPRSWRTPLSHMCLFMVTCIAVLALYEIPYIPLLLHKAVNISFRHMDSGVISYAQQLWYYIAFQSEKGSFHPHLLYVLFLAKLNGTAFCIAAVCGLIILIRRASPRVILCVVPTILLVSMLSLKTRGNSVRYISLALPFIALFAGIAFAEFDKILSQKVRVYRYACIAVSISIALLSVLAVVPLLSISSGYSEMAEFLKKEGGEKHLATNNSYSEFYFGRNIPEQMPRTARELQEYLEKNMYTFVVLDFMSHRVIDPSLKELIERTCIPYRSIHNPVGENYFTLLEGLSYRHEDPSFISRVLMDPHAGYIDIYDAHDVLRCLHALDHAS